ncbi:voltage-dependent T-type calcium channel subunit alpha-1H-like [Notothenia coriiceps]|uniref:Voltage-dependent T-type calcium channel subunit alpha-1H-like n=1 Tax=Notothenia coriiceps TaxID=8208 RepID=A0A6I9NGF2_9TELE|nr:PREDICTED: voltage-dependent T-type calcium channel subunit alpha-1H-like [Notothenia coriiceps]
MLVILLNCVTLGMFQPCEDVACQSEWCGILQVLDDCIFAFFAVEMVIKMVALGIFGPNCYLGDKWNQLDFVIVMAGVMEYSLDGHNASLSAIRTVRVLRPLRAINRVPIIVIANLKLGLDRAVLQSMTGNKEGNNNGPVQQFSKKEIEDLLRKGAYAAIMDENDEGNCFCEEDIDQILQRRATFLDSRRNYTNHNPQLSL